MTQEQAVKLWNQACYLEPVSSDPENGVVCKTTPFVTTVDFLGVKTSIKTHLVDYMQNKRAPVTTDVESVATFLRQWADALEGK